MLFENISWGQYTMDPLNYQALVLLYFEPKSKHLPPPSPHKIQMEQNEPSSLKFTLSKHIPTVYIRLHSRHWASLYKTMQSEAAI